ncbi:discoidin domain-containing protein [Prevotellamassilia timonensis]|uniref:discoidin domain-containing protein n=1 Tax=Prevotellamassilia timonensis TaxID=1852370 RepID=UPI003FF0E12F
MKKITFMLSLLMSMGAMTTSAQVLPRAGWTITTSSECDDSGSGHAAAIIDGNNNTFWHTNWGGYNASGDTSKRLPQFFQVDLGSEQEFQTIGYMPRTQLDANGVVKGYKLYVSNNPFETVSGGKTAAQIVSALGDPAMEGTFSYDGETSASLKTATATSALRGRYVLFVVTDAVTKEAPNCFATCAEFYLAKGSTIESKTMTYHYKVDGVEYATRSVQYVDASTAAVPTIDYLTNGTITDNVDGSKDVACTTTYPFVAQTTFDANTAHWYSMAVRANDGNHLLAAKDNGKVGTITKGTLPDGCPEGIADEMQWAFVGNLKDGFKLYNKANNKQIVVKQVTETKNGKTTTYTQLELADNEGAALKLRKDNNGFGLYATEGNCFNRYDQDRIAQWEGFDDGSTFRIQEPNDYVLQYAARFALVDDSDAPEGAIGANSYLSVAENSNAFKAAYTAASAEGATAEQIKALAAENGKVAAATTTTMEIGKYYRLYNKAHKKYACLNDNPAQVTSKLIGTVNGKGASSVFYIENAETGRYRIKVGDLTLGKASKSTDIALGDNNYGNKGSYVISHAGKIFWFFDKATNSNYSYIHAANDGANMVGWEAKSDTYASQWYVVPATDVEIDMTAQGDKKYASAYLPFGVSNVAGATAYTGALNAEKNAIDMTATTSVPANIGFVLVGTENKATLTIGEATAIAGENVLTGTNTGIAFAEATPKANYLVFGVNADKVGFYTPGNVTAIPANKAYINASALSASAIALNFGNTVTGINAATINNGENNAPIYDLSGRRVWAPVKGGLYIQNGKKLVK